MYSSFLIRFVCVVTVLVLTKGSVLRDDDGLGLYDPSDDVKILTERNFNRLLYRQRHAIAVQFYNHNCGHCRAFSPTYKELAHHLSKWKKVFQLAVLDCADEKNVEVCRNFEIMMYPTMRYFHENFVPGNGNYGDRLNVSSIDTVPKATQGILQKLSEEQRAGRFQLVPSLRTSSYDSYASVLEHVPQNVLYTFVVFENHNSSLGKELILDTNDYHNVMVKSVDETSNLARSVGLNYFPSLVAVRNSVDVTPLQTSEASEQSFLKAINNFLRLKNIPLPADHGVENYSEEKHKKTHIKTHDDNVYYSDLEKTIKLALHTEVPKYKIMSKENVDALLKFLDIVIRLFPFAPGSNLPSYLADLKNTISRQHNWEGQQLYDVIKRLEASHAPVYVSNIDDYIGCKGSAPQYRGYTCGLWTLFHTLTVSASQMPTNDGPQVLQAMYGYVKNFFSCTTCVHHFLEMAAKNRIFDVKDNNKAVLWLWISHNEVNLRLAGDYTEDPEHPKIQFPSSSHCPVCRQNQGAWNLPAVYDYLRNMYAPDHIKGYQGASVRSASSNIFSSLEIGMLSLLYILSFAIIILVIKLFLTKRFYRRRFYKHDGRGKV